MNQPLDILFEDNHVIVINKSASDIVQGDKTGDETLPDKIKAYLKVKYDKPGNVFCGVVHRLDRPTSGAVVFARTSKALERLNAQFRDKETNKVYWAIVEQRPEKDKGVLLEIHLETGRHHQIRCQLAQLGCIIKGDLKYGAKRPNTDGSISLHARELTFTHPTSKESIHIVAPIPSDSLWEALDH
ncbi:MAG: RluA family pseudouridine synthase [Cryomorphaceae bacterium]|nr:RluA family pseudouridine synthase [Cryomorphaceae bacterium]